ncbi:ankyrin repeat-containing protein [Heterostelium album PN500]|uniref:Ankyrin repeat-containing protein n=1 Tax=Heterostelium pallidum (strain ATCC 26659 / Pp 5 / PN500) TaxID=670386 RepID=D3AXI9_HETP5|nr:ankyrin repeat-containing protein [Heterostelium album PN500]EFA86258.1 ankyrin repeat-containing protein [Heterostelium album PN500]|eukprot:XP_020438363.1 ankyrin repeat-containing protein [Heterostelium album PN500]
MLVEIESVDGFYSSSTLPKTIMAFYDVLTILICRNYLNLSDLKPLFQSCRSIYQQNHNDQTSDIEIIKYLYIHYLDLYSKLLIKLKIFNSINSSSNNVDNINQIQNTLYNNYINNIITVNNLIKPIQIFKKLNLDIGILVDTNNILNQLYLDQSLEQNEIFQSIHQQLQLQQPNHLIDKLLCYSIINNNDTLLLLLIRVILLLQSNQLTNSYIKSSTSATSSTTTTQLSVNQPVNSLRVSTSHQKQLQQVPILNIDELSFLLKFYNSNNSNNSNSNSNKIYKTQIIITVLPLFIAANQKSSQCLKLIVDSLLVSIYSNNINVKLTATNRTALFYSTSRDTTLALLQYNAKIDAKDTTGMLPIHYHSLVGNLDVIKCLLDDTTINAQDLSQNTPLHWSSLKGHLPIVKYLISSGAKLNIANHQGRYPIHNAALEGHIDIIKYLVDLYAKASLRGSIRSSSGSASIQIPDRENNTPIDLAILKNHFYCTFELLRYEGASSEFDFTNGRKIGSGAFADVYLLEWRKKQVAVKRVKYERLLESGKTDEWIKGKFLLEVVLMVKLSHLPSFVKLYGTVIEQNELLLIGNDEMITNLPSINLLSQSMANGMAYLHGLTPQIIHRDLTSQNILLDANGSAKIADFGISRFKNDIGDKTMTAIGNPRWRAPEVTKGEKYSEKVDVFGFGMILYELFTRRVPFHDYEPVQASFKVVSGERPIIPPTVDSRWAKLIQRCWDHLPANRPSFQEIIQIIQQLPIVNIKVFTPNDIIMHPFNQQHLNSDSTSNDVSMSSYEGSYEIS